MVIALSAFRIEQAHDARLKNLGNESPRTFLCCDLGGGGVERVGACSGEQMPSKTGVVHVCFPASHTLLIPAPGLFTARHSSFLLLLFTLGIRNRNGTEDLLPPGEKSQPREKSSNLCFPRIAISGCHP